MLWIGLFFWIRKLPVRIYLFHRSEKRTEAKDYAELRRAVENTALTSVAGGMAIAGVGYMAISRDWETWSLLFALPLVWVAGLRSLLRLPDTTDPANSLLTSGKKTAAESQWLRDAELEEEEDRQRWENR